MKIKCFYDKTLKMSNGKLAAQVGHVVAELVIRFDIKPDKIVVLEANHSKFNEYCIASDYTQVDWGLTEVFAGTKTVCGFVEEII